MTSCSWKGSNGRESPRGPLLPWCANFALHLPAVTFKHIDYIPRTCALGKSACGLYRLQAVNAVQRTECEVAVEVGLQCRTLKHVLQYANVTKRRSLQNFKIPVKFLDLLMHSLWTFIPVTENIQKLNIHVHVHLRI